MAVSEGLRSIGYGIGSLVFCVYAIRQDRAVARVMKAVANGESVVGRDERFLKPIEFGRTVAYWRVRWLARALSLVLALAGIFLLVGGIIAL
jgi:hypothetical protein